jgi:hypothetical protein
LDLRRSNPAGSSLESLRMIRKSFKHAVLCLVILSLFPAISFAATYWADDDGSRTSLSDCQSTAELSGPSCCSLATVLNNVSAGDTIYLREGIYHTALAPRISGVSGNVITYQAYNGETVTISNVAIALYLNNKSYLKIDGIDFTSYERGLLLNNGSSYNEISNCTFTGPPTVDALKIWDGQISGGTPCTHNWLHHNQFLKDGFIKDCSDDQGMQIGVPGYDSDSGYNTVENNIFAYGGHHVFETFTPYNVIRSNFFHNEDWMTSPSSCDCTAGSASGRYGNRNIQIYDGYGRAGVYNLVERNRFGASGHPPDDDGGESVVIASPRNIVRYNDIFQSASAGAVFKMGGASNGCDNRFYNNTVAYNGVGDAGARNIVNRCQFEFYGVSVWSDSATGNIVKNNLFYGNTNTDFGCKSGSACLVNNTFVNNYLNADGDPLFTDPSFSDPASTAQPDFSLKEGSGAVDRAGSLTRASEAGINSTSLQVDDALYFQDGSWGSVLSDVQADWIAVGTVDNTIQISSIDYATNTITLTAPLTWSDKAEVWLYKNSTGKQVLYGSAPDMGASESGGDSSEDIPPSAPSLLRVSS